jgi:hypothetical protein
VPGELQHASVTGPIRVDFFPDQIPMRRKVRFKIGSGQDRIGAGLRPAHMAVPYSLDLRERVVAAVVSGMSRARAAAHYQVSHSLAIRWTKRQAETGRPAALPMGGKKPLALADQEA